MFLILDESEEHQKQASKRNGEIFIREENDLLDICIKCLENE